MSGAFEVEACHGTTLLICRPIIVHFILGIHPASRLFHGTDVPK